MVRGLASGGRLRLAILIVGLLGVIAGAVLLSVGETTAPPAETPDLAAMPPGVRSEIELRMVRLPEVRVRPQRAPTATEEGRPYRFSSDWFSGHVPIWEVVLAPFVGQPDVHFLEIGLFEGRSALWVLENILTHETAHLTGIDPFLEFDGVPSGREAFYENLALSGLEAKVTVHEGLSQDVLRRLPLESFDIAYIDGSHTAPDVLEDAILVRRLLKPGAVLIFDDYLWELEQPARERPKVAIDLFFAMYGHEFDVLHVGYQVFLRRR